MGNFASCKCYATNKIICKYCKEKYCDKCKKYKHSYFIGERRKKYPRREYNIHSDHQIIKCNCCSNNGVIQYEYHYCKCYDCHKPLYKQFNNAENNLRCSACYEKEKIQKLINDYQNKNCKHGVLGKCYECVKNYYQHLEEEIRKRDYDYTPMYVTW